MNKRGRRYLDPPCSGKLHVARAKSGEELDSCSRGDARFRFSAQPALGPQYFNVHWRQMPPRDPLLAKWLSMPNGFLESNSPTRSGKLLSTSSNGRSEE